MFLNRKAKGYFVSANDHVVQVARTAAPSAPFSVEELREFPTGDEAARDAALKQIQTGRSAGGYLQAVVGTQPARRLVRRHTLEPKRAKEPGYLAEVCGQQFRIEAVLDRVNTFGTAFLGLTLSCAQCHDHKFDPVTQRDYYRLYAFFNNSVDDGHGDRRPKSIGVLHFKSDGAPDGELETELADLRGKIAQLFAAHGAEIEAWRLGLSPEARDKVTSRGTRAALDVPWEKLSFNQRRSVYPLARTKDTAFRQLNDRLGVLQRRESQGVSTLVMEELPGGRPSHIFIKGDFTRPGDRVEPGTPVVLPPLRKENPNRLDLARWTVDPANPLTARVQVNRLWQQLFRNGIVKTSDDFGLQSSLPTHPELLDYLAVDFRENKWDIKRAMKNIVMSSTYRQSSKHREDLKEIDPENKLLARAPRFRFPAELIRDNALAASGLLNEQVGGPSVKPYQPEIWKEKSMAPTANYGFYTRHTGDKLFRRGLYTLWKQSVPPAQMEIFDAPSREFCSTRRALTNSPTQAFVLMNDETYLEFSRKLAERLFTDINGPWQEKLDERLRRGFRLATGRNPKDEELQTWISFTNENLERFSTDPGNAEKFLSYGETPRNKDLPVPQLAALSFSMSTLLNLDETITRD